MIDSCLQCSMAEEEIKDAVLVTDGDSEIGQVWTVMIFEKYAYKLVYQAPWDFDRGYYLYAV